MDAAECLAMWLAVSGLGIFAAIGAMVLIDRWRGKPDADPGGRRPSASGESPLMEEMMFAHSQCAVDDMVHRIKELVELARDGGNFEASEARRFLVEVIEGMPDGPAKRDD